jgi:hypothetical protein
MFAVVPAALLFMSVSAIAGATTIDFSNLVGANGDPYAGTVNIADGFNVQAQPGKWFEAQIFGNPIPSIFAGPIGSPSNSGLALTLGPSGTGTFTFDSVDLACNNGASDCKVGFLGLLNGIVVLNASTTFPATGSPFGFVTQASGDNTVVMDTLAITVAPGDGTTSMNVDNIVVNEARTPPPPVPEPGTVVLLGAGLLGLASRRRRAA